MINSLKQDFINPPEEFTPIPFWFWNDHLTKDEILRQINDFFDKGVTGFVLHPRIGVPAEIGYLSKEFMDLVYIAVEEAKRLNMSVILYDEAMYPSGSAKGMVVKDNPEYASRGLKMIEFPCEEQTEVTIDLKRDEVLVSAQAIEKKLSHSIKDESTKILSVENDKVRFDPPNDSNWSIALFIETFSKGTIRGINFGEDDGEENAPASADLLNPDAVEKFIRITHDTYYETLKEFFGDTVIAMFTDEPDILGRNAITGLKPWTSNFLSFFIAGENEETDLPILWFGADEQTADVRKNYRKSINKLLTKSYYKQISEWCEQHQIALTGHPEDSDDIGLLEQFQIPGQDVVWRWVAPEDGKAIEGEHSTAGKCSSDAARHRGRRRNLNEVLGVCSKESDWALSPGDMKWYLDWLLVRGVNMLSPHAFYYSIDGKKRSHERPPDVGPNNHWWPYYKQYAQYMKRLSWLMTDSVNMTTVAVLCEEDHLPWKIVKPLFEKQVEFNYLEESLFLSNSIIEQGTLSIVDQVYQIIIIEDTKKLGSEVVQKLERFIEDGGEVIVCGQGISDVLIPGAKVIVSESSIIESLPAYAKQEVIISPKSVSIRFSKVRKDDMIFYLFVNEGEENFEGSFSCVENGRIEKWDPWEATIEEVFAQEKEGHWNAPLNLGRRESIVYCIDVKSKPTIQRNFPVGMETTEVPVSDQWVVTNEECSFKERSNLSYWNKWVGFENYSGTFTYENQFEVTGGIEGSSICVDLGEVHETAHVFINGIEVGVKMWAPYSIKCNSSIIKEGVNTIIVHVKNSLANKMDKISLRSGLVGPVTIKVSKDRV